MQGVIATEMLALQILFVGDSITAGGLADPGLGYVERIAAAHPEWDVVNAGCQGASTLDWTLPKNPASPAHCSFRGAFELLAAPYADADVVHILLGTNDAVGFGEDSVTAAADYIDNISALAARFSGDVLVSFPPPVPDPESPIRASLDQYTEALLARLALPAAPFRAGADFSVLDPERLIGVHPDNMGHAWLAQRLMPLLVPEPVSAATLLLGLYCLALHSRRTRRKARPCRPMSLSSTPPHRRNWCAAEKRSRAS